MDLERELRTLPIEWPATPQFELALARRRKRWPVGVAIALAAIAAALAVPQSRGAILRFFDIGGDRIQFVNRLPRAAERPLDAGLGVPGTVGEARQIVPGLLLPQLEPLPQLRLSGNVVSLVFLYAGKPVLLSEFRGDDVLLKKLAGTETDARSVTVRGPFSGLWLSGSSHVVIFPREPTRLAGNTLIWRENVTTYRLEGRTLTKRDALDLARSLVDTP